MSMIVRNDADVDFCPVELLIVPLSGAMLWLTLA